jgi:hypothetical protein
MPTFVETIQILSTTYLAALCPVLQNEDKRAEATSRHAFISSETLRAFGHEPNRTARCPTSA